MRINFRVKYSTVMGQSIVVVGNHKALGDNNIEKSFSLTYLNKEQWGGQIEIKPKEPITIEYQYVLRDENLGVNLYELKKRTLNIDPKEKIETIDLFDTWSSAGSVEYCFETSMFDYIAPKQKLQRLTKSNFTHQFEVKAPLLKEDETVVILGNIPALSNWNTTQPILMKRIKPNTFVAQLNLSDVHHPFEYKYGIYNAKEKYFTRYELGENRFALPVDKQHRFYCNDEFVQRPTHDFWRGAGVAIPVFSLRSHDSLGVGEFLDLKLMGDWAAKTQMRLIQILPVNDTTANNNWVDSYPYAAISVFAMHPQYLKVSALPYKMPKTFATQLKKSSAKLNESATVQYEEMMQEKWKFITEIFTQHKEAFLQDKDFQSFYKDNKHWLEPYAVFCVKRDENQTPDFSQWKDLKKFSAKAVAEFAKDNEKVQLQYFVQYHLHKQLLEAVDYLHQKGIVLKGDIPIGIYRYSCDAWVEPALYNMNMQAGAPPDDFAVKGQNWGFPTYNWDKMEANDFKWWKDRFTQLSQYFDSFRIDHILGFFRIWQIPLDAVEGILGFFEPALPITVEEITQRGVHFDYERFCKPYINDFVLSRLFGNDVEYVKNTFVEGKEGIYHLKPEFDTQIKVQEYCKQNPQDEYLKQGLFDLIANIILIEVAGSNQTQFHPRYGLNTTLSYEMLDDHSKHQLYLLYVDYFYNRQEHFWEEKGYRKLPAIKRATNMLICGEDLGMVPACVPKVMKDLGILSLEVQRMPKDPKTLFFNPEHAPYMSVVSPSSHDTSTLRGWWEESAELRQIFYNTMLDEKGEAPAEMTTTIVEKIITQHFNSQAMLAIFPIQDYLAINAQLRNPDVNAERINIPAIIPHYWNYRMHLYLEDLLEADEFNEDLAFLVKKSGRM